MDFKLQLEEVLKKYKPANYGGVIKSKPDLYQWLKDQVKIKTDVIAELLFLYQNPDFDPVCKLGKKRKYQDGRYFLGCGKQCECVIEANSQTQREKHQKRTQDQKQIIREKTKNTLL
jgi:hypothetical protein